MAGRLTTHVLDTAHGRPAANLLVELFRAGGEDAAGAGPVARAVTNADGRCPAPLLEGAALEPGRWRLLFHVGAYFRELGAGLPEPAFLDRVPVEFGVADAGAHHHVPLLVSPYGYSTYRGS